MSAVPADADPLPRSPPSDIGSQRVDRPGDLVKRRPGTSSYETRFAEPDHGAHAKDDDDRDDDGSQRRPPGMQGVRHVDVLQHTSALFRRLNGQAYQHLGSAATGPTSWPAR